MGWLQTVARRVGESPDDWLSKAEAIGEVELENNFGGGKIAQITIGNYRDVRLQVWGQGSNSAEALRSAVEKATPLVAALMEVARR